MSSTSPPPNSSPSAVPPASPSNSSATAPPPQPPPPVDPAASPPSPPQSPPPATVPPSSSPPPSPPTSPPPSPPASPPPSPPTAPPPATPPPVASPPPPTLSPPPPSGVPPTPSLTPPPPPAVSPSPPPPVEVPPPPSAKPPKHSPPPPPDPTTPPVGNPPPPPSPDVPPGASAPPPSAPVPPSPFAPSTPPLPPTNDTTVNGTPPTPLPNVPTEKPTARSTTPDPNINADTTAQESAKTGHLAAIGVISGLLVLSLLLLAVWFIRKRKKRKAASNLGYMVPSPYASSQHSESSFLKPHQSPYNSAQLGGNASSNSFMNSPEPAIGNSRTWFTYEELADATNGFSSNNILGEGGFGCVYKGVVADGREVAVKQLKSGGGQGEREFRAEVEIISRVHHRHLVSLVGYCISENQRLLVYDYVPNNTLDYHLHGKDRPVMNWEMRVKVAAGAARGIAYLHEDCHPRIIHRDIKSSNILLDSNFEARVADFGLARLAADTNTHVSTRVMGTFGYLAPEYASTGKLTEKSDVFSFGVVLLELITGRKPVDASQPLGDESLVEWARPLLAQAIETEMFEDLVDSRLEKNYVEREMFRMIEAAAACIRHLASKRPRMSQVVRALDSMEELSDLTNGMKPGQSGIFDSREQSAQIRMFQRMAFGSQEYSSDFFNYSGSQRYF